MRSRSRSARRSEFESLRRKSAAGRPKPQVSRRPTAITVSARAKASKKRTGRAAGRTEAERGVRVRSSRGGGGGGEEESSVLLWLGLRALLLLLLLWLFTRSSEGVGKLVLALAPRNSRAAAS